MHPRSHSYFSVFFNALSKFLHQTMALFRKYFQRLNLHCTVEQSLIKRRQGGRSNRHVAQCQKSLDRLFDSAPECQNAAAGMQRAVSASQEINSDDAFRPTETVNSQTFMIMSSQLHDSIQQWDRFKARMQAESDILVWFYLFRLFCLNEL